MGRWPKYFNFHCMLQVTTIATATATARGNCYLNSKPICGKMLPKKKGKTPANKIKAEHKNPAQPQNKGTQNMAGSTSVRSSLCLSDNNQKQEENSQSKPSQTASTFNVLNLIIPQQLSIMQTV